MDTLGYIIGGFAHGESAHGTSVLQNFDASEKVSFGIGLGFAVLSGHVSQKLGLVLSDETVQIEQVSLATHHRSLLPFTKGLHAEFHTLVEFRFRTHRHQSR